MRTLIRTIVATLFTGLLLAIAAGVAGEFFIELAREKGWYDNPSQKLDAGIMAFRQFVTQAWFLSVAAALGGLAVGLWLDWLVRRREASGIAVASEQEAEPTVPPDIDYGKVRVLAPEYRYELTWDPEKNLQILTQLRFIPFSKPKPDSRLPMFSVKNLTTDFLRNVRVRWRVDTAGIEDAIVQSKAFQEFNAVILSDYLGGGSANPARIPYKAIQIEKLQDGTLSHHASAYQLEEETRLDLIDPAGEVLICPMHVYTAIELYLTALLAGQQKGVTANASIRCDITINGNPPVPFSVFVSAHVLRSAGAAPGLVAWLETKAEPYDPT